MTQQLFRPLAACAAFALALGSMVAITFVPPTVPLTTQTAGNPALPELA